MILKISLYKKERSFTFVDGESEDGRRNTSSTRVAIEYGTLVEECTGMRKVYASQLRQTLLIPEETKTHFYSDAVEVYNEFSPYGELYASTDTGEVSKDYGQLVSPSPWRTPEYNQDLMDLFKRSIK